MSRFLSNCSSYKCYVEFQIFSISQMEIRLIATRGFANMHSICKVARGLTKYFLFGWLHAKNAQVLRAILFFFRNYSLDDSESDRGRSFCFLEIRCSCVSIFRCG